MTEEFPDVTITLELPEVTITEELPDRITTVELPAIVHGDVPWMTVELPEICTGKSRGRRRPTDDAHIQRGGITRRGRGREIRREKDVVEFPAMTHGLVP
jgi:hypothetical protein